MNLGQARIVLRPRSLAETFDLAFRWTFAVGGRTYAWLALVLLVPPAVLLYGLEVLAEWPTEDVWLLAIPVASALQAPFTIAASQQMFDPRTSIASVAKSLVGNLGGLLAGSLVRGTLLLVSFGFAWPWLVFMREAVLLEGQPVLRKFAAVRRSGAFVRGQVWHVIALVMLQTLVALVFVVGFDRLGIVVFEFGLGLGRPFGSLEGEDGSLFALLGLFAAVPYLATVRFLDYVDSRTRRDGWDLQLAFLAIIVADRAVDEDRGDA